jgi:hypothetical protein
MLKRLALISTLLILASMATAQDFFHRPSPLAGRTLLTLALFDEVKAELKTTADESAKQDEMLTKLGEEIQEAFSGATDFTAVRPTILKINDKYDGQLVGVLTADQLTRLKQLFIQYNGASSVRTESIAKDLALTDDQKAKIKKLQDDSGEKNSQLFQQGLSPEDMQKEMTKQLDQLNADIEKVFTDDQKAKLKAMEGAKFEFKKGS